jgi:hypothetical protein
MKSDRLMKQYSQFKNRTHENMHFLQFQFRLNFDAGESNKESDIRLDSIQ